MLFWILLGVVAAVAIGVLIYFWYWEGFGVGLLSAIGTAVFASLVGLLIVVVAGAASGDSWELVGEKHREEYRLRALSASSEIEGRISGGIFVTSGYVDQEPVFRYLREEGDALVLRSVPADRTLLYQGDYEPGVVTITTEWGKPWIHPWTTEAESYEIYVPEGSVSSEISVAP